MTALVVPNIYAIINVVNQARLLVWIRDTQTRLPRFAYLWVASCSSMFVYCSVIASEDRIFRRPTWRVEGVTLDCGAEASLWVVVRIVLPLLTSGLRVNECLHEITLHMYFVHMLIVRSERLFMNERFKRLWGSSR